MLFSGYKTSKSFKSTTIVIIVLVGSDLKYDKQPWLVWLSGLSASLQTKGSLV